MTRVEELREASDLPLSAMQLGIWFAQQIDPLNPGFNIGEYVEVSGTLDPDLFERALQRVVTNPRPYAYDLLRMWAAPGRLLANCRRGRCHLSI